MNLQIVLLILLSLGGFFVGYALRLIAPEELKPGKRYFHWVKYALAILVLVYGSFLLVGSPFIFVFFIIASLVLLYLLPRKKSKWLEIAIYIAFLLPFLLPTSLTLYASLLFLYGLPTGTLWQT
jgi:hypothetical protein